MSDIDPILFGNLFKKLRLKAEIPTLTELGELLANNGYIYDDSLLSHWQKGRKIPTRRNILVTLIKIFSLHTKISLLEANELMQAAGQGYLTHDEELSLQNVSSTFIFQAPPKIPGFVGRKKEIKEIINSTLSHHTVYIVGKAGVGKTALAIEFCHLSKTSYIDGVLWYRVDKSSVDEILCSIAEVYGENITKIKNFEIKATIIRSILSTKKVLLILDNVESSYQVHFLLQNCDTIITTQHKDIAMPNSDIISLQAFDNIELEELFKKITGKEYLYTEYKHIIYISNYVGGLPLALAIIAHSLSQDKNELSSILNLLKNQELDLENFTYDNKNLEIAINISVETLPVEIKKIFFSLGIFWGKDFSLSALCYINNLSLTRAEKILQKLINICLVERSDKNRFRLHPLIATYIINHSSCKNFIIPAMEFFILQINKNTKKKDILIRFDFDNIYFLFKECYKYKLFSLMFDFWPNFSSYLWNKGYWIIYRELSLLIYKSAIISKNYQIKMKCCIKDLSWCYFWQGKIKIAEKYLLEGLKIANKINNFEWIYFGEQRLGKLYQGKGYYEESNKILSKSLIYFEKNLMREKLEDTLSYIGENYWLQNKTDIAEYYFNKVLILGNSIKDLSQVAIIYSHLGGIMLNKNKYKDAKIYFAKSMSIANRLKRNAGGYFWNNLGLGLVEFYSNNTDKSTKFFTIAKTEMLKLGIDYKSVKTSVFFLALKNKILKTNFLLTS